MKGKGHNMQPENTNQAQDTTQNNKELNFRALEQKYQRQIEHERAGRLEAERMAQEAMSKKNQVVEEEDDNSDPYVDHKRLNKTLTKHGQQIKQETQSEIQKAVQMAIHQERQQNWLKQNSDFENVMQHADKLYNHDPELADSILEMPNNFERQKLVYKNIKALGLHEDKPKQNSIQDKIDANRRNPGYQPSGMGTAPYASQGDFSDSGQKQAYDKMQELKSRMRLG